MPVDLRDVGEIERAVAMFAQGSSNGLIVTGSPAAVVHRELIISLAARHRLPAVYNTRVYAASGSLISYGPDFVDQFRFAAGYVDRILKGEKPSDLPVQAPTRYRTGLMSTRGSIGWARVHVGTESRASAEMLQSVMASRTRMSPWRVEDARERALGSSGQRADRLSTTCASLRVAAKRA